MPKKLDDLALKAFLGSDEDDYAGRLAYFKDLSSREAAGEKLDDEDANWLALARRGNEEGKSLDDLAVREFSRPVSVGGAPIPQGSTSMMDAARRMKEAEDVKKREQRVAESPTRGFLGEHAVEANRDRTQTVAKVVKDAANYAFFDQARKQKHLNYLPNPEPGAQGGQSVLQGTDEMGRGIQIDTAMPAPARRPNTIALPSNPHARVATSERGEDVDARGRVIPDSGPALYVYGQRRAPGFNTLERRPSDIVITKDDGLLGSDKFSAQQLEKLYGKHLKAMEENRDANGNPTDKFPEGYFGDKPQAEIDNIYYGVKALKKLQRGIRT